jgi:hypothetical protein
MTTGELWYYLENGQQSAPVTREQILARARSGALSPDDLVWTDGMADWAPLKTAIPDATHGAPIPSGQTSPLATPVESAETKPGRARMTAGMIFEIVLAALGALMLGGIIVETIWGMRVHDFSNKPYLNWILTAAALILVAYWRRERRLKRETGAATGFADRHGKWARNVAAGAIGAGILFTATCWSTINEDIYLRSQGYGGSASRGSAAAPLTARSAALKSDLRNLATAEEMFFADSSHYATRLDLLQFTPATGDKIRITGADAAKWGAVATYGDDASKGCAIWTSTTDAPNVTTPRGAHPPRMMEPLCDPGI